MHKLYIMICLTAMVFNGCASKTDAVAISEKSDKVIINDIDPSKKVKITSFSTRYVNDILEAYVEVQNFSKRNYEGKLEYRFQWLDKEEYEIGENLSIWKPLFIGALESKKVEGFAPTPKADSFKFYLREIKR